MISWRCNLEYLWQRHPFPSDYQQNGWWDPGVQELSCPQPHHLVKYLEELVLISHLMFANHSIRWSIHHLWKLSSQLIQCSLHLVSLQLFCRAQQQRCPQSHRHEEVQLKCPDFGWRTCSKKSFLDIEVFFSCIGGVPPWGSSSPPPVIELKFHKKKIVKLYLSLLSFFISKRERELTL